MRIEPKKGNLKSLTNNYIVILGKTCHKKTFYVCKERKDIS